MYKKVVNNLVEYYEYIGWTKDTKNFLKIDSGEIKSCEVFNFILDEVV